LAETFEQRAGTELALADVAALLTLVMSRVGERTATVTLDPQDLPVGGQTDVLRLYALQVMGARVIRAARARLMYGYEGKPARRTGSWSSCSCTGRLCWTTRRVPGRPSTGRAEGAAAE
jgi:hypothetical protein